jgi:3-hydroxyisobutyrate dehydrogenase-like beta-hydroxyacid dehydrogenase
MQGVTALPSERDVCSWSDIVSLCGSYEEVFSFFRRHSVDKALLGKFMMQLGSGTPEDAVRAARLAKMAGTRYLDAFVFVGILLLCI